VPRRWIVLSLAEVEGGRPASSGAAAAEAWLRAPALSGDPSSYKTLRSCRPRESPNDSPSTGATTSRYLVPSVLSSSETDDRELSRLIPSDIACEVHLRCCATVATTNRDRRHAHKHCLSGTKSIADDRPRDQAQQFLCGLLQRGHVRRELYIGFPCALRAQVTRTGAL